MAQQLTDINATADHLLEAAGLRARTQDLDGTDYSYDSVANEFTRLLKEQAPEVQMIVHEQVGNLSNTAAIKRQEEKEDIIRRIDEQSRLIQDQVRCS